MNDASPPPQENPFAAGQSSEASPSRRDGRISNDPSVDFEPHLSGQPAELDPSEEAAGQRIAPDVDLADADRVEHSVWDEPALAGELAGGAPDGQITYARWLDEQIAQTTPADTWRTTLLLAAAAGPWGLIGAFWTQAFGGGYGLSSLLATAVFAPVTEEITKVAALLWTIEKRPFRFRSTGQIVVCAAAGALVFAAIENGFQMSIGGAAAPGMAILSTALHVACSALAGVGLSRIWGDAITNRRRPELAIGMPQFAAAMTLHGLFNAALWLARTATGW